MAENKHGLQFASEEVERKYYEMLREFNLGHVAWDANTLITEETLESLRHDFALADNMIKDIREKGLDTINKSKMS